MPVNSATAPATRKRPTSKPRAPLPGADVLTPCEVAHVLGLSIITLARYRVLGTGPTFYKPSARVIRYRMCDVVAYLGASVRSTTEAENRASRANP